MPFNDLVTLTDLGEGNGLWRLERPLDYLTEAGEIISIGEGFITDGPSIPRWLWIVWPIWGRYGRAGVLHDYLYFRIDEHEPMPQARRRRQADYLFLEAMESLRVNPVTRHLFFVAVRLFGVTTTARQFELVRGQEKKLRKRF